VRKRQEALRRGLRSLIQDTSRELAQLEGREALVSPVPDVDDRRIPPAPPVPREAEVDGMAAVPPAAHEANGTTAAASRVREVGGSAPARPAPRGVDTPDPVPRTGPEVNGVPAAPSPPPVRESLPPAKVAPPPRAKARRRARHRAAPLPKDDGVSPQQAQSRKGVCFAYFVNAECWRVPEAYCNTALEVCITRECPVFHLHKDALERRFAGKYKHFW